MIAWLTTMALLTSTASIPFVYWLVQMWQLRRWEKRYKERYKAKRIAEAALGLPIDWNDWDDKESPPRTVSPERGGPL